MLPLVAMQFTDEVNWDETDFIVAGAMLLAACGTYELAARLTGSTAYRAAAGVAVVTAFVLVWINLAVGIFGSEDNPANLMFGGVLAVGAIGALVARFRAGAMARALEATALAQALIAVIALIAGFGGTVLLAAFFAVPWLASAQLFRIAAREQGSGGRSPVG
ncbi:hypothetical protein [Lysobacter sp. D1-1-M9]|uniref:hypothetical protein n=1 Tax=Novilysobacter longmucuonensis TaxID=3098603 RepID=UPI002FCA2967